MPSLVVALILSGRIFTAQANLTWYDPALGGINCDHDCTTVGFSTPVARNYGSLLACPIEFPRGTVFIIRNSWRGLADGWWTCWDAGGQVVINPDGTFQLDLMSHYPIWKETLEVEVRVPGALGPPIGPHQLLGELERLEVPLSICIPKQAKRVQEVFLDSLFSYLLSPVPFHPTKIPQTNGPKNNKPINSGGGTGIILPPETKEIPTAIPSHNMPNDHPRVLSPFICFLLS